MKNKTHIDMQSQNWKEYYATYSEPYHLNALIFATPIYLSWTWLDQTLIPYGWKFILGLRIFVAASMILFYFLRKRKLIPVSTTFFIPALLAMNGIAWMIPFTDESSMGIYFMGYTLGIVVMGLYLFVSYFAYTLLMLSCIISTTIGFIWFSEYDLTFFLTRGGIAWVTAIIFSYGVFESKMRMLRQMFVLVNKVEVQNQTLEQYANTDFLTKTFNRRYLDQIKDKIAEEGTTYSVLFCDVNELKRINDVYGHEAGDTVIVECCNLLRKVARKTDIIIRQGGDELIVICPATNGEQIQSLIRRVDEQAQKMKVILKDPKSGKLVEEALLMSMGYATSDMYSKDQIIKAADDQMQLNKQRWYEQRGGTKYR